MYIFAFVLGVPDAHTTFVMLTLSRVLFSFFYCYCDFALALFFDKILFFPLIYRWSSSLFLPFFLIYTAYAHRFELTAFYNLLAMPFFYFHSEIQCDFVIEIEERVHL